MNYNYFESPIDKEEQYNKIIMDTEEIIKNFKEISEILSKRADEKKQSMYTLGKKVVHERDELYSPYTTLGNTQVKFL
jgi:hypothetical protein